MSSRTFILAASLLASSTVIADVSEEERFSYTIENGGRLSLENVNGGIEIVGGTGDQVEIVAYKKANNREALDDIEIIIDATPSRISVDTNLPSSRGWFGGDNHGAQVRYELSVPAGIELSGISSVNGGIDISGVFGPIKAETVNGSIEIEDASADLKAETVNGSIDARFAAVTGDQRIECDTVNGRISLSLPANADARVSVDTVNGGINASDFDLVVEKGFIGKSLNGDIGDGSARINANTVNGGVRIRQR